MTPLYTDGEIKLHLARVIPKGQPATAMCLCIITASSSWTAPKWAAVICASATMNG